MTDEIEQLLRNLHLKKIAAIVDDELAHADKHQLSYSAFLARLLRAQYHHRTGDRAGVADHAGAPARGVDHRIVSLQATARREREADPRARGPRVCRQGREPRVHWADRRGEDRTRVRACCSKRSRTAIAGASSARRISSTRCMPRSPIARRAACSTRCIRIDVLHIDELGYLNGGTLPRLACHRARISSRRGASTRR